MSTEPPQKRFGYLTVPQKDADVEAFKSRGAYCPSCFPFSNDLRIFSCPHDIRQVPEGYERGELGIHWKFRLVDLKTTAEGGCQWCTFFACRFFGEFAAGYIYSKNDAQAINRCCGVGESDGGKLFKADIARIERILEKYPDADFDFSAQPVDQLEDLSYGRVRFELKESNMESEMACHAISNRHDLVVELYAVEDDPAAKSIKTRPIATNPASKASLSRAQCWIAECLDTHPECPGRELTTLPSRIIKILDDQNLVLHVTKKEESGSYIALSYVWGEPQTFSTTLATVEDRRKGFRVTSLPQTLQDAVFLARKLGSEYLWIDSICIIQDCDFDRETEISKMAQYYSNSLATISGGLSSKASGGFLDIRNECESHPGMGVARDLLRLSYVCPENKDDIGTVLFREQSPFFNSNEPVNQRAWTLQERILSPRVLIIVMEVWRTGPLTWKIQAIDVSSKTLRSETKGDNKDSGNEESFRALLDIWYRIVHEYSCRCLTVPDDKLPAVSGLAMEVGRLLGVESAEYVAGLWRSQLHRELMWSTHPYLDLDRSPKWRAPSWSWASLDNQITFNRLPPPYATQLAEIIECSVKLQSDAAPFGEILSGKLRIRGYLMEFSKNKPKSFDRVVDHMRNEYLLLGAPHDMASKLVHDRMALNFRGQPKSASNNWSPPEKFALLALFAQPVEERDKKANIGHRALKIKPGTADQTIESYQMLMSFKDAIKAHDRSMTENIAGDQYVAFVARYGPEWPDIGAGFEIYQRMLEHFSKQVVIERKLAAALEKQDRPELEQAVEEYNAFMVIKLDFTGNSEEVEETGRREEQDENEQQGGFDGLCLQPLSTEEFQRQDMLELPAGLAFSDDTAWLSCLVLVKQDDGRFERISCLRELPVRGMSNLKKFTRMVEII